MSAPPFLFRNILTVDVAYHDCRTFTGKKLIDNSRHSFIIACLKVLHVICLGDLVGELRSSGPDSYSADTPEQARENGFS